MPLVATPYNCAMSWARWAEAKQKGQLRGIETPFPPSAQTSTTWPSLIKTLCFQEAQLNAYCSLKAK